MRIEIINTGNELLLGTTLNTHGAWIGQELLKYGLRVSRQVTVSDGTAIRSELGRSLADNDVVIITGGLGPTSDDLTREEVAAALEIELIEDEFAVRTITEFFRSRGKQMAECNLRQAQAPVGADILPNNKGTAPGIYIPPRLGNASCAVFLLPGPPFELKPMFCEEVVPRLQSLVENPTDSVMEVMSFIGIGESNFHDALDARLGEIKNLEIGYCARPTDIDLRLIGNQTVIDEAKSIVKEQFGHFCYTNKGESLEQVVVRLAMEQGLKIATAESCTGGYLASRLTDVSGSSAVFTHGFVTYANEAKEQLLGVENKSLVEHGAVSEQVAKEMAEGALASSGADLAVAVTGIAGPTGGTEEKPVGTVWMAISQKAQHGQETEVWKEWHPRGREIFKNIVSQRLLGAIWNRLK